MLISIHVNTNLQFIKNKDFIASTSEYVKENTIVSIQLIHDMNKMAVCVCETHEPIWNTLKLKSSTP